MSETAAPTEPPIGTWVKDRHGAAHVRVANGGWGASASAVVGYARWEAMWTARGPLTPCGPYGAELDPQ